VVFRPFRGLVNSLYVNHAANLKFQWRHSLQSRRISIAIPWQCAERSQILNVSPFSLDYFGDAINGLRPTWR
jgi:hypothetical protein